jgi:Protein of unknown function (DUF4065)
MTEPEYDAAKFEELLLYVTERTQDDPACGDMKLNKLLYFADFLAFEKLGHAISGAPYQRLPWGPAPRYLLPLSHEDAVHRASLPAVRNSEGTLRPSPTPA